MTARAIHIGSRRSPATQVALGLFAALAILFAVGTLQLQWVHADPTSPLRESARLVTEDQRAFDACGYGGGSLTISAERLACQHSVLIRASRALAADDPLSLSIFATTAIRHAEFAAIHQAAEQGVQRRQILGYALCGAGLAERAIERLREVPAHGLTHWTLAPARLVLAAVTPSETLGGRGAARQMAFVDALDKRLQSIRPVLQRSAYAPTPVPPSCAA